MKLLNCLTFTVFSIDKSLMWKRKSFSERKIPEQRIGYLLAVVDGKAVGFVQLYKLFHYTKLQNNGC